MITDTGSIANIEKDVLGVQNNIIVALVNSKALVKKKKTSLTR